MNWQGAGRQDGSAGMVGECAHTASFVQAHAHVLAAVVNGATHALTHCFRSPVLNGMWPGTELQPGSWGSLI